MSMFNNFKALVISIVAVLVFSSFSQAAVTYTGGGVTTYDAAMDAYAQAEYDLNLGIRSGIYPAGTTIDVICTEIVYSSPIWVLDVTVVFDTPTNPEQLP